LIDHYKFGGGELERYGCPQCGCVLGAQKYLDLDESFVDLEYQLLYSRYSEGDSTDNEIMTFQSISPVNGGIYLDWAVVGCGAGRLSNSLARVSTFGAMNQALRQTGSWRSKALALSRQSSMASSPTT
jgi:hypothetical protein